MAAITGCLACIDLTGMRVQRDYVQAEKEHAAMDEDLTRSYTHNIEVQTSQQDRAQRYRRSESAKQAKVTCMHCQVPSLAVHWLQDCPVFRDPEDMVRSQTRFGLI